MNSILRSASLTLTVSTLFANFGRADVFKWEYVDPSDPSQGKQESAALVPDGGGVNAIPGTSLIGLDLTMAYLQGSDLTGAMAQNTRLEDAALASAILTDARLDDAILAGADLRNVNLNRAALFRANLTAADLTGADVRMAALHNTVENGFTAGQLYSTSSYQARDLTGIVLAQNDLSGWSFVNQNLTNASFHLANLTGTEFTGAIIRGATFTDTSAHAGNLTEAQLYSTASYQAGDLQNMHFSIEMVGWNMASQDLQGSDFQIDVSGTDFSGANLINTSWGVRPIDLEGTDLTAADARGAVFNVAGQPIETNMIREDGEIDGLHLVNNSRLLVRDDTGVDQRDPIPITVHDALMLDLTGELHLLIGPDDWDSLISFDPGIPVDLDSGVLRLDFADDVDVLSQLGRTLRIFDWTGVSPSGVFSVESEYQWDLSDLYSTGEVTLLAIPEPTTLTLAGLGLVAAVWWRRRRCCTDAT